MLSILNTLIMSCILLVGIFTILFAILSKMEGIPIIHHLFQYIADKTKPKPPPEIPEHILTLREQTKIKQEEESVKIYNHITNEITKCVEVGQDWFNFKEKINSDIEKLVIKKLKNNGFTVRRRYISYDGYVVGNYLQITW